MISTVAKVLHAGSILPGKTFFEHSMMDGVSILAAVSGENISLVMSIIAMLSSGAVWVYQIYRDRPALRPQLRKPFQRRIVTYQEAANEYLALQADGKTCCVLQIETELMLLNYSAQPDAVIDLEVTLQNADGQSIEAQLSAKSASCFPVNVGPQSTDRLPLTFFALHREKPAATFDKRQQQGQAIEATIAIRITTLRGYLSAPALPLNA